MASREAFCYVWDQTLAKKGSDEVSSCLYQFIMSKIKEGAVEFRFFSDNCSGQNRNRFVFGFYSWVSQKYNVNITHTFLEKGHTQNEGDSVHANIERNKKNTVIYVPSEWYNIIRTSKVNGDPYKVIEMNQSEFFDFKEFVKNTKWDKDTENKKMEWNHVRALKFDTSKPYSIYFKIDLSVIEKLKFTHPRQKFLEADKKKIHIALN